MGVVLLVFLFIGLAIAIRLIAGSMDEDRVGDYVRSRGGRLLSKEWAPFGRGWVGEKDSRIYNVTYEDAEGALHEATCKTSAFSGVYFTEDRVVRRPPAAPVPAAALAITSRMVPSISSRPTYFCITSVLLPGSVPAASNSRSARPSAL